MRHLLKHITTAAALFFLAALFNIDAHAQSVGQALLPAPTDKDIPRIITYQGQITTTEGSAMNGTHHITATLYPDPHGLHPLWQSGYDADIKDGIFTVTLGGGAAKLPENAALNQPLWIGISIDGSAEMQPLTRLTAAPYALNVPDQSIT